MLKRFIALKDACNRSFHIITPCLVMVLAIMRQDNFAGWWLPAVLLVMVVVMKLHQLLSR